MNTDIFLIENALKNLDYKLFPAELSRTRFVRLAFVLSELNESDVYSTLDYLLSEEGQELLESVVFPEDAPTNNIGAGNIAVPEKPWRKEFAGQMVFRVSHNVFHECRMGKYRYHRWQKYVGEDEIGCDIRDYGLANRDKDIIVQDEVTEAMVYLRKVKR